MHERPFSRICCRFLDHLEISSCKWVPKRQRRGSGSEFGSKKVVGSELLSYLIQYLATTPTKCLGGRYTAGLGVYVLCPRPEGPANKQFPAGSKGFCGIDRFVLGISEVTIAAFSKE